VRYKGQTDIVPLIERAGLPACPGGSGQFTLCKTRYSSLHVWLRRGYSFRNIHNLKREMEDSECLKIHPKEVDSVKCKYEFIW
jgi:hypothetical protein